jgi:hypothetical protein
METLTAMASFQDVENGDSLHPPDPRRAETRLLPMLRSCLESILSVPPGKERVLARLGRADEIITPPVLSAPAALLNGRFEHPAVFFILWDLATTLASQHP